MRLTCVLLVSMLVGCTTVDESDEDDGGTTKPPENVFVGVEGVTIREVAIYQGVKRTLALNGQAATSTVPLVAGRDALVRVFYDTTGAGRAVTGRLELEGGVPIDAPAQLVPASSDADLASTVNFIVPGARVGQTFNYRVSIGELVKDTSKPDPASAHYPQKGLEAHPTDGSGNTFRVVLAPFRYDADGSGRLPNLSPERVEAYRTRLLQLYPVSKVEVTVREPQPWSQPIYPNGQGWQQVGFATFGFRSQDGMAADVYYYAVFNPANDLYSYCGGGCLLGVTLLNDQPPEVGDPQLRLALGVGFDEVATDTAAHELGHAHGRMHAPCGLGVMDVDPQYPYEAASIGVWGWDIVGQQLIDPATHTDIMSYCDNQWISDYNFAALLYRSKNVNLPKYYTPVSRAKYAVVAIDGEGASWQGSVMLDEWSSGRTVPVDIVLANGQSERVGASYHRYDHLPGGWLLFPEPSTRAVRVETTIDERRFVAEVHD